MKYRAATIGAFLAAATIASAADAIPPAEWNASPLVCDGALQTVREPLAKIFQFTIEGGKLRIDRAAWEPAAKEYEKNHPTDDGGLGRLPRNLPNNPQLAARMQEIQKEREARQKERLARLGPIPPLHTLFRSIQDQARKASHGRRWGGPGRQSRDGWREWQSAFATEALTGRLRTNNAAEEFTLEETQSPKRLLEFFADRESGLRIQLASADGDRILLQQQRDGRFSVIVMQGESVFVDQGESFVAVCRQNRQRMDAEVLPALAQLGIAPILPSNDPEVCAAVSKLLLRTPEALAEGRQLLTDLGSDTVSTRKRAVRLLSALYDTYLDLIQNKLHDPSSPHGVRSRLREIVGKQTDSPLVPDTIAVLDLVNDPGYVASLLDDADPRDFIKTIRHLKTITGQKLGADPAAWKEWATANRKP